MQRVARVLIKAPDEDVKSWADDDEESVEDVIKELKQEVEDFFNERNGRNSSLRKLPVSIEFVEWETFCPKCESTDLKHELDMDSPTLEMKCICTDCAHEFGERIEGARRV